MCSTADEIADASAATIDDYAAVAQSYADGNMSHDVSQNVQALLTPLADRAAPLDILDVCCASGRDLVSFSKLGHRAVGLDGVSGCLEWSVAAASDARLGSTAAVSCSLPPSARTPALQSRHWWTSALSTCKCALAD